jgi:hypothetical protein
MAHLPPRKCLPLKYLTSGFGAVKLMSAVGLKYLPGPEEGGPSSMFHEEGASIEVTGILVCSSAAITEGKGSLTSPEKLKP